MHKPRRMSEGSDPTASLDAYCERLTAAFERLRHSTSGGSTQAPPGPVRRGNDSLDDYFDRLSKALAQLEKPINGSVSIEEPIAVAVSSEGSGASTVEDFVIPAEVPPPIEALTESIELPPAEAPRRPVRRTTIRKVGTAKTVKPKVRKQAPPRKKAPLRGTRSAAATVTKTKTRKGARAAAGRRKR